MKKPCLILLAIIALPVAILSQQGGDYRSVVNNGNWSTASTWETFSVSSGSWVAATSAPVDTNNVTVRSGFNVILDASGKNCNNLTIEAGATLTTGVALPTSSIRYLRIHGGSVLINGAFGDATTGDAIAVENAHNGGTVTITGTGTFAPSRLRVNSSASGTTTVIGMNTKFMYTGSSGTGGVALYPQTDGNTFVVNAGDTVTFVNYASVAVGSSVSTASGQSVTYIVNGRIDLSQPNSTFNIKTSGAGTVGTLVIGANGSLSVGKDLLTSLASDAGSSVITDSGTISIGGTFHVSSVTGAHFRGKSVIQGSGNVTIDSSATATVAAGDTLTISSKGNVYGALVDSGAIITNDTLTFYGGSTYTHAVNGGSLPNGIWNAGSTCELTGITNKAPSNGNQNLYNIIWNSPSQSSNLNLGWNGNTIGGDITIVSTGSGRWQLCAPSTGASTSVTINGNITMSNGQFTAQGTSNGNTIVTINVLGNVSVTGGNFSVARGSQGGTGTTTWNLYGDFSMSNATTQNSNSAGAKFVFKKQGTQNLTLGTGNTLSALPIEVSSGARLNLANNVLAGSGIFAVDSGATIETMLANGFDGNLTNTGTITLRKGASYIYDGSVNQVTGTLLPDTVNVLKASLSDTLSFSDSLAASNIVVSTGSTLNINQKLKTAKMDVSGTILAADTLMVSDTATFESGSVYNHAMNGGTIPTGKWNTGSTLMLTGITGNSPSNGNQNFYNVVWNCPSQSSNLNLGWKGNTIGGNITVVNTGGSRWQLCAPAAGDTATVTINGSVNVSGGQFSSNGTSNANTVIVINQMGDVNVTGGNFSVSRGSQGSGSGSTRWKLYGDFMMSNATTQNSNSKNAWFVFAKQGTQKLLLGNGNTVSALPIEVSSGTTLDLDTSVVAGSGLFIADSGAVIITRHTSGIGGNLTSTGALTFNPKTDFVYAGKIAQITGALLPDTLNNLTIDDTLGVVLTQPTLINGALTLKAGVFNNAIAFTLGPSGMIVYAGGKLLLPVSLQAVTIAEARKDDNHDGVPDHKVAGDTLKITGVITSPNFQGSHSAYFVQDATAGIELFHSTKTSLAIGDSVSIIGKVDQYNGLTEFTPLVMDSIHLKILKNSAVIPTPMHLTLHQYVANAESYEGLLIEVDTLYKASGTWGSGASIYLMNGGHADTAVLYINANTNVASATEPQYPINVVGIASQYSSSGVGGYEIIPRDTSDIKHVVVVGVQGLLSDIPKEFYLSQNYPNPFNPSTTINFGLPKDADVQITVYNILGQKATVLVNERMHAGNHQVVFNSARFASGMYIYVMRAGDKVFKEKMLLLK
ncbi:MAG: T9SS type A sorting domain-containing protein [Bacteroidota bacterium]|nr:T9SS type A sorting domain-containing protein [Bacteroidota bacterium]